MSLHSSRFSWSWGCIKTVVICVYLFLMLQLCLKQNCKKRPFADISFSGGSRKSCIQHVPCWGVASDVCQHQIHLQIPCRIFATTGEITQSLVFKKHKYSWSLLSLMIIFNFSAKNELFVWNIIWIFTPKIPKKSKLWLENY